MYLLKSDKQVENDTRSIFMLRFPGLNSEFSFTQTACHTKIKMSSLLNYLSQDGGSNIGFIPSSKGISAMWNANSLIRIWNHITLAISYNDNHCTTSTSIIMNFSFYDLIFFFSKCRGGNVIRSSCSLYDKLSDEQSLYKYICSESCYTWLPQMSGTFTNDMELNTLSKKGQNISTCNLAGSCQCIWVSYAPLNPSTFPISQVRLWKS